MLKRWESFLALYNIISSSMDNREDRNGMLPWADWCCQVDESDWCHVDASVTWAMTEMLHRIQQLLVHSHFGILDTNHAWRATKTGRMLATYWSHDHESKVLQYLNEKEMDDFEDPVIRKVLDLAAEAPQQASPNRHEPKEEHEKDPDHKIEESQHVCQKDIQELEDSVILNALCFVATEDRDEDLELGTEQGGECVTQGQRSSPIVSEVTGTAVQVNPSSATTSPPGLTRQSEVARRQNQRPGAVAVGPNASLRRSPRWLATSLWESITGSRELRQSLSSSMDLQRRSEPAPVVAEVVTLEGEFLPQQHEEMKAQMRTMILNEAVQAEIVEEPPKGGEYKDGCVCCTALSRSNAFRVCVCILLMAVIAMGVIIGMVAGGGSDQASGQIVGEPTQPEPAPSAAPSITSLNFNVTGCWMFEGSTYKLFEEDPRVYAEEYVLVREALRSNLTRFDVQSLHDDECSPSNLAIWWLAAEYNFTASPLSLMERYGLAVLFFSVNGGNIEAPIGWFRRNSSECSWLGIVCHDDSIVGVDAAESDLSGRVPSEIGLLTNLGT